MAIGRFQVMAILQAARAYLLGLDIDEAKSFGLNRAIFYAAAKRGFKHKGRPPTTLKVLRRPLPKEELEGIKESFGIYNLGDEMAYCVRFKEKTYFVIGDQIITEKDFSKQVERRFGSNFDKAWEEAIEICSGYDKGVLLSQHYFYETVYKPRRDILAKKWSKIV